MRRIAHEIRRIAHRIVLLNRALSRIRRLDIETSLKRKMIATWFNVFFLKSYDFENRIAKILGYKIAFLSHRNLQILFNELFVNMGYDFVADSDNPFIIDCGSNIGMSIIFFKTLYPHSRIIAFEPGKEAYSCLEENVKNNGLTSVTAYQVALANKKGTVDFFFDKDDVGSLTMSTKPQTTPKQMRSVEACILI